MLIDGDNMTMRYNFACIITLYLKDYDAAIDLLEQTVPRMFGTELKKIFTDPDLDALREMPRFEQLISSAATIKFHERWTTGLGGA